MNSCGFTLSSRSFMYAIYQKWDFYCWTSSCFLTDIPCIPMKALKWSPFFFSTSRNTNSLPIWGIYSFLCKILRNSHFMQVKYLNNVCLGIQLVAFAILSENITMANGNLLFSTNPITCYARSSPVFLHCHRASRFVTGFVDREEPYEMKVSCTVLEWGLFTLTIIMLKPNKLVICKKVYCSYFCKSLWNFSPQKWGIL